MIDLRKDRPRWRLIVNYSRDISDKSKHRIKVKNSDLKSIRQFVLNKVDGLPRYVQRRLVRHYVKIFNQKLPENNELFANIWLRDVIKPVKNVLDRCPLTSKQLRRDEAVELLAKFKADECLSIVTNCQMHREYEKNLFFAYSELDALCDEWQIDAPYQVQVGKYQIVEAAECAILRMCCEKWWYRKLKRIKDHTNEHILIVLGDVQKKISPYISAQSLSEWKSQQKSNKDYMEAMELVQTCFDESGQEFENVISLAHMFESSSANPKNRFTELMVRCRGLENLSLDDGFVGQFLTITTPSKYHATLKNGKPNPKYIGVNPKQTQAYLVNQWAKIRAQLKRDEIIYYGVRVVEPHHDGTPHWHLLLFVHPEQKDKLIETCRDYALEIDGLEEGAQKHRFTVEEIDPAKGSATGYIAKYLSKNINGEYINGGSNTGASSGGTDDSSDAATTQDYESGKGASEGAQRATAWASRWNLRQFQFFGAEPVTIYREARRLSLSQEDIEVERIRLAVESKDKKGKWYAFTQAMREARVNLAYELSTNDYAESVRKIKGLISSSGYVETRESEWVLRKRGSGSPRSPVTNCTGSVSGASELTAMGFTPQQVEWLLSGKRVDDGHGISHMLKYGELVEYRS